MASIRINPIYAAVDHEHPYLPLVGGTLTGTLVQNGGNVSIKAATLDRDGDDPSETIWEDNRALNFMDKDDETVGRVRIGRTPGGVDYLQMLAGNEDGDGNFVYNTFSVAVGKDGTRHYAVSDAAKFRSDLGIIPANIGAVSKSGDTMTGDLGMQKANGTIEFHETAVSTRVGQTGAPNYFATLRAYDKNNDQIFYSQNALAANGNAYRSFVMQRMSANGATTYQNGFYLGIDTSGDPYVSFTSNGAAAWRTGLNAVNKSGDTMTGSLYNQNASFLVKWSSIIDNVQEFDRDGANPTADRWAGGLYFRDADNEDVGFVRVARRSNGAMDLLFYVYNEPAGGGTLVSNSARFRVTRDGAQAFYTPGSIENANHIYFGNGTTAILYAKTPSRTGSVLMVGGGVKSAGDENGTAVRLGAGGLTIVGGGEYPYSRYNLADLADGAEVLYLGADSAVYIETNGNTIANRHTFTFGTDGTFNSPSTIKQNGTAVSLSGHTHTKAQVGLGNVDNKSSATIRGELTKANVTDALGYTPWNPETSRYANNVLAAPKDANGTPSFRLLVAADIPDLPAGKITSGTLGTTHGGTGSSTFGSVVNGNGTTTSVGSGAWKRLTSSNVTLSAGTWVVFCGFYVSKECIAGAQRIWGGFSSSAAADFSNGRLASTAMPAYAWGTSYYWQFTTIVQPSSSTTYYALGWQNSGSSQEMSCYVRAFKLK